MLTAMVVTGALLVLGGFIGIFCSIGEPIKWSIISGLSLLLGIVFIIVAGRLDTIVNINSKNITTEYALINSINGNSIILDDQKYNIVDNANWQQLHPINVNDYTVGEIVKFKYIQGNLGSYLISLEDINKR
jgi:hypothetical protein